MSKPQASNKKMVECVLSAVWVSAGTWCCSDMFCALLMDGCRFESTSSHCVYQPWTSCSHIIVRKHGSQLEAILYSIIHHDPLCFVLHLLLDLILFLYFTTSEYFSLESPERTGRGQQTRCLCRAGSRAFWEACQLQGIISAAYGQQTKASGRMV